MKKFALLSLAIIAGISTFSQSKKDLQEIIAKRDASIDSLNKVVANQENIIENRDRSIRFLNDDIKALKEDLQEETDKRREKHAIIQELRKQSATGEPKIMYMSNTKNVLRVPKGKYWMMHQFMCDYSGGMQKDTSGNTVVDEVHVFLLELNGTVLTDTTKNMYGPKLFSSLHPEQMIRFPIVFTEDTFFKVVVLKGDIGNLSPHGGKVYCTYTENDK